MAYRFIFWLFSLNFISATVCLANLKNVSLKEHFKDFDSCFVLYEESSQTPTLEFNPEQCQTQFSPCSTFKVPNSLIALDTKVLEGAKTKLPWDGTPQPFSMWEEDQTLRSAISRSVVWYYQAVALRIGEERMKQYLERFDYGNQDISGGITQFWLGSTLKISAREQIAFWRSFWTNEFKLGEHAISTVKDILVWKKEPSYTVWGKTGSSAHNGKWRLGWYVGRLETNNTSYFFATNIKGDKKLSGHKARQLSLDLFKKLGLTDAPPVKALN